MVNKKKHEEIDKRVEKAAKRAFKDVFGQTFLKFSHEKDMKGNGAKKYLNKAAEILETKDKSGKYRTVKREDLAFVMEYINPEEGIPAPVWKFLIELVRGETRSCAAPAKLFPDDRNRDKHILDSHIVCDYLKLVYPDGIPSDTEGQYESIIDKLMKKYGKSRATITNALSKHKESIKKLEKMGTIDRAMAMVFVQKNIVP